MTGVVDIEPFRLPNGRIDVVRLIAADDRPFEMREMRHGSLLLTRPGRDQFSIGCKYPQRKWSYSLKYTHPDFYSQVCIIPTLADMIALLPDYEEVILDMEARDRARLPEWYPHRGHPDALVREHPCSVCGEDGIVTHGHNERHGDERRVVYYCQPHRG